MRRRRFALSPGPPKPEETTAYRSLTCSRFGRLITKGRSNPTNRGGCPRSAQAAIATILKRYLPAQTNRAKPIRPDCGQVSPSDLYAVLRFVLPRSRGSIYNATIKGFGDIS